MEEHIGVLEWKQTSVCDRNYQRKWGDRVEVGYSRQKIGQRHTVME